MKNLIIHSHACLEIRTNSASLLVDPWLLGSCYWRSWWNYPPVKNGTIKNIFPSIIYITHVHWDHWHGPTLKYFLDKNVQIVTHDEPNKRSYRDLKSFGFKNIKILKHGESWSFSDITITPYQFGLFLNDSAVVIETPQLKLLDANDCKIAGQSLEQIKNKHGLFDFALRSHSSANDRICYSIEGSETIFDNPLHYTKSFKLFMDNVKPRFAIPFASNHCHLHKDVFHFNDYINDPFKLRKEINRLGGLVNSNMEIMLSGDSWSKANGFDINSDNIKYFKEKDKYLLEYQKSSSKLLDKYYESEGKKRLGKRTIKVFKSQLDSIPKLFKLRLKNWKFVINVTGGTKEYFLKVQAYNSEIIEVDQNLFKSSKAKVIIPVDVFNSAVNQNMFHHSGISKRNRYIFSDRDNLKKWEIMNGLLEKVELEVFPLKGDYMKNVMFGYFRRWREVIVYFQAFWLARKGMKMYDIQEKILSKHV